MPGGVGVANKPLEMPQGVGVAHRYTHTTTHKKINELLVRGNTCERSKIPKMTVIVFNVLFKLDFMKQRFNKTRHVR